MNIQPNSIIRLLSGCKLNRDYEHTIWFNNVNEQTNYFNTLAKYTINDSTYQRYNKGTLKVGIPVDNLYDCNYMMFQNTSFNNKWFYAFILDVEYDNNDTSIVTYEIDVMQTWLFEARVNQCFVEREHSVTDVAGENTIPESLELGEYITTHTKTAGSSTLSFCLMTTEFWDYTGVPVPETGNIYYVPDTPVQRTMINGIPYPVYTYNKIITPENCVLLQKVTSNLSNEGKADTVVCVFAYPTAYININNAETLDFTHIESLSPLTLSASVRNNKLKTYPYVGLMLQGGSNSQLLHYELFRNPNNPQINVISAFSPAPSLTAIPMDYDGVLIRDYSRTVSIQGYPLLPWVKDYYQNWLAQNKSTIYTSIAGGIANAALGVTAAATGGGGLTGARIAIAGVNQVMSTLAEVDKHSIMPDTLEGTVPSLENLLAGRVLVYRSFCRCIKPEYIRIIDSFFDKYGYATHLNKVPNRNSRPHWNYVKTQGAYITGNLPNAEITKIANIYDKGVTFWKNGNNIGNYNLDNRP